MTESINNSSVRPVSAQPVPIGDVNIETYMMMVNIERAEMLDGQLKDQLDHMKAQNDELKKLNDLLNKLRSERGNGNDDRKAPNLTQEEIKLLRDHGVDIPTETKHEWESPTASTKQLSEALAKITEAINRGRYPGMGGGTSGTDVTINGRTVHIPRDASPSDAGRFLQKLYPDAHDVSYDVPKGEKGPDYDRVYIEATKTAIDSLNSTTQLESIRMQSLSDKRDITYKLMSNLLDKFNQAKQTVVGNLK
jgi:hypothetical protein